jgi:hypothetical protein
MVYICSYVTSDEVLGAKVALTMLLVFSCYFFHILAKFAAKENGWSLN